MSKTHQKEGPRALGALQFNAVEKMLRKSWFNVMKGARKVGFMVDLLYHKNFGPNVDVNFCGMKNDRCVVIIASQKTRQYQSKGKLLLGGVQQQEKIIIITIIITAGWGGSKKRETSNEGRTHSCALIRKPTTLCCGKK